MVQHDITIPFKARYFKIGEPAGAKEVWFVIHGYGQLAQYFIKKFQPLEEYGICVIAPEGLSRFYLEDITSRMASGNNRVGATWMTKESRLTDIENYLTFLNSVYAKEVGEPPPRITIVGFSQGCATASRWVADGKIHFDRFILWAGLFPPDMNFEAAQQAFKHRKTMLVYGNRDPFLNDSRFAEMDMLNEKLAIRPETFVFDGGHDIHEKTLQELAKPY